MSREKKHDATKQRYWSSVRKQLCIKSYQIRQQQVSKSQNLREQNNNNRRGIVQIERKKLNGTCKDLYKSVLCSYEKWCFVFSDGGETFIKLLNFRVMGRGNRESL